MTNRWLKMLSIFLSLVLIFNLLPLQVLASGVDNALQPSSVLPDDGSSGSATAYERLDTATIVEEDTSRRGEYYKEFVLNNGLRLAAVYTDPVHYADGGEWKDIDNTLKAISVKGVAGYTNTAGVWQVYFPQQLSDSNAISVTKDGYTVSFGMAGELTNSGNIAVASIGAASETLATTAANASAAQLRAVDLTAQKAAAQYEQTVLDKHQSKLAYASVYNNTEIVYDLSGNRLKESIVISKYNASLWGYRYNLNTGGLIPVLLEDNTIELRHPETAEVIMTMPAPFMVDANYEYNYDVDVTLVQSGTGYLLSYYVPRQWLASADRAWPVVLDPVVDANNVRNNIQDISVAENTSYSNNAEDIRIGYNPTAGIIRAYLRYKELPTLTSSSVIINAQLTMTKLTASSVGAPIEVHKVDAYWQPSGMTWATKPAFNDKVEDVVFVKDADTYTWDITNIAVDWYSSTKYLLSDNTGLMFKASDEVEDAQVNNWQRLCSSDGSAIPQLQITYQDTAGLEDYWDYTTVSAGRAGTGYVHNHSGNLVWVHNDMGFDGNLMPVSINHVYNPSLSASNEYGLGYGWQTNYHQTVKQASPNSYVWTDGDGTPHYFYSTGTGVFQDEDNLHLTLSVTDTGYEITDQYRNKSVFQFLMANGATLDSKDARLASQMNNQSTPSTITVSYAAPNSMQIFKITDGVGRVYSLSYSNGLLDKIQFKAFESANALHTIQFAYNDSSQLSAITYADGEVSSFTYHTRNLLTKVQNIDGYNVNFSYGTTGIGKPRRVKTVIEKDGSQTGSTTAFTYGLCRTKITTRENEQEEEQYQVYYFDKWGNTVSAQDEDGRTTVSRYAPVDEAGDFTHLLTAASSPQITVSNMLSDSSFENGTVWTAINGSNPQITTNTPYIGQKSMSFDAGVNKGVRSPVLSAQPGESYTFSAYVKSANLSQVRLSITAGGTVEKSQAGPAALTWVRLSVTYQNDTDAVVQMYAEIQAETSCNVQVDCVQVEKDKTANRYNLLHNTDFANTTYWAGPGFTIQNGNVTATDSGTSPATQMESTALRITGAEESIYHISQTVPINQSTKKYVISGWAKVTSLPTYENTNRAIALQAIIKYSNNSNKSITVPFGTSDGEEWQYVAAEIDTYNTEGSSCVSITVTLVCENTPCTVYFDGIGLYYEPLGESYSYDDYGNVSVSRDALGNEMVYRYDNKGIALIEVDTPTNTRTVYTYDTHYNVVSVTEFDPDGYTGQPTEEKTTTLYEYDGYGNVTKTTQLYGTERKETFAEYTDDGNYLVSITDESGYVTIYGYLLTTGMLDFVMSPNDTAYTVTEYTYDSMFRTVSVQTSTQYANYTYEDDQIKTITSPTTGYTLNYGLFGLQENIKAGSFTLASYKYTDYTDRYLEKLYYGSNANGTTADYIVYTYDEDGRVTREDHYENGSSAIDSSIYFEYNDRGQLAVAIDDETNITRHYGYDELGRIETWYEEADDGSKSYAARYAYDGHGNVSHIIEFVNGKTHETVYFYDSNNRPSVSNFENGTIVSYEYDKFDALIKQTATYNGVKAEREYTYRVIEEEPATETTSARTKISSQVSKLEVSAGNYSTDYQYTYSGSGNIKTVTAGGKTTRYTYDACGQLIREDNEAAGKTWTWTYDAGGNILNKKEYTYTTGTLGTATSTKTYTYGNAQWGDLLTAYSGKTISYDQIGNPLSDGEWSYTWEHGRQLASMTKGSTNWAYSYDADGLRTQRTNGSATYEYFYSNGVLKSMNVGTAKLVFDYDANGLPLTLTYKVGTGNETVYFFVTNLQGDVVAIVDTFGNTVAAYTYDAWGRVLTTTGSLASTLGEINPLRYRGYVYDHETKLYYLQSRYYNPEWGRFINADNQLDADSPIGLNLFAYCGNNPVNRVDPTGEAWWHWALGAVVVAACAVATVVTCGGFAAAATAVCLVGNGVAAATTASTIAAAAFIGSATVYGAAVLSAASTSDSMQEFFDQGSWSTVVNTVLAGLIGGYDGYSMSKAQTPTSTPTNTSHGSTGRTEPANLREQLAMEQVKSNPLAGTPLTKITLNDPRWPSSDGWVKMQQIVPTSQGNINIHYVYNPAQNRFADFKFKS